MIDTIKYIGKEVWKNCSVTPPESNRHCIGRTFIRVGIWSVWIFLLGTVGGTIFGSPENSLYFEHYSMVSLWSIITLGVHGIIMSIWDPFRVRSRTRFLQRISQHG